MKMPKAHLTSKGLYESKGIDPATGKRKSYYAKSEAEASEKAARSLGIIGEGEPGTLYEFYATTYLPTVAFRSQNWLNQIAWAMDKHVLPALGDMQLTDITRQTLQRFFNGLGKSLSPRSVQNVKTVLSTVLNLAEGDEIAKNFSRKVRIPPSGRPNKTALTFAQLGRLLEGSHTLIKPFVLASGFCGGLRAGEACALTRAHVKDGSLRIRQQVLQLSGGAKIVETLKTPQTRRDIPLPDELQSALLNCGQVSGIYIVSNSDGGYLLPKNAARELRIACEASSVPVITPHELRHTFISLMENVLEAPPAIVAALAGKKDDRVNGDYSHTHQKQMLKWMTLYFETALREASASDVHKLVRQSVS